MKNLINKKAEKGENGIAILFSLIMLMTFFMIAFGFVSMTINHRTAAKVRQPDAQASLSASDTVFNLALRTLDKGIFDDEEIADQELFEALGFTDTSITVDFYAWGTDSGDNASLADYLELQLKTTDFKPDTGDSNWGNFGWLTADLDDDGPSATPENDKYAFMILEADGLDANYLGGKNAGGTVFNKRWSFHKRTRSRKPAQLLQNEQRHRYRHLCRLGC